MGKQKLLFLHSSKNNFKIAFLDADLSTDINECISLSKKVK